MRWWSGLGFGVGIALLVQAGCGGRSTRQDASEGGGTDAGSNGAGRFGADAGSAAGPGAGKGGAEAAPNGELEYDECDGVARQSPFCNRVFASCPPELDEARRLPRFCERDVTNLEYSECDGYVRLEFVWSGSNEFELVFDERTGGFVSGFVSRVSGGAAGCYLGGGGLGTRPSLKDCRRCSYCDVTGYASASPGCELDDEGRVLPPAEPVCECRREGCEVAPEQFCPEHTPFDCPITLDSARTPKILCTGGNALDPRMRYGECENGEAFVSFSARQDNTTLVFSQATGELVSGRDTRATDECRAADWPYLFTLAGPELDESSCTSCSAWELCFGSDDETGASGAAGASSAPGVCVLNDEGRISLP